jgi:biotin transporter BioY
LRKEWVMASYVFGGTTVFSEKHGYRVRFYSPEFGYIGSYYPATKVAGFSSPSIADPWKSLVSGPKAAAKACLAKALERKE